MTTETRLNKYLASCGVASRRACDELIANGHVEINGRPCLTPGAKVKEGDHVKLDGKRITVLRHTTILLNKPRGLVCTKEDELNRETIYALLPTSLQHLHHVGRLDAESEGLLLLTNDGDLTQKLMHPSNKVEKEYLVTVNQPFLQEHLDLFLTGVYTKEGKLSAKALRRESSRRVSMILDQGAKRQIRVMMDTLSYQVTKLVRVRIGSLWGGDLEVGRHAILDDDTIRLATTNPRALPGKWMTREQAVKAMAQRKSEKPQESPRAARTPRTKSSRQPTERSAGPRKMASKRPMAAKQATKRPSKSFKRPGR
jgi:pseudouridine synthase